jgi:hypothetical protein
MKYKANRGGHAPGDLRDAFVYYLEQGKMDEDSNMTLRELIGKLWNCTDILPSHECEQLNLPRGSTYAQAVRAIHKTDLEFEEVETTKKQLTASEAADIVAERYRSRSDEEKEDSNEEAPTFTCENCGCHNFRVVREFEISRTFIKTLNCTCEDGDEEIAGEITTAYTEAMREISWLDEDHHWDDCLDKETIDTDEDKINSEINCQKCFDEADETDWHVNETDFEDDKYEYWVECSECDHKIEFGWSHPERGGRIWPCEASDFNPWKSWPEPRYKEAWEKRGWRRP